jgi:malate dehydrogenase (oxaloacetate-decarboxylating)
MENVATKIEPNTDSKARIPRSSAGFSLTFVLKIRNQPGAFAKVTDAIAKVGGSLAELALDSSDFQHTTRAVTVHCRSEEHMAEVEQAVRSRSDAEVLELKDDVFEMHKAGKINVEPIVMIESRDELSRAYTPGVARVCMAIAGDPTEAFNYTVKANMVAVVSDGSAVLGLGNIGARGAIPVMEGKAMLFRQFAGVNAFPICLDTQDTEEVIKACKQIAPVFGGINLEDIAAPRCFEIEERLQAELDIPVFHDDQHGTAVVVLAALMNAAKLVGKKLEDLKVVVNGFGAGGVACTRIMLAAGVRNIIPCDTAGAVFEGRTENMNGVKSKLAKITNPEKVRGTVGQVLKGADVFLGVSAPGCITRSDVASMAKSPIVFALANPVPEIMPEEIADIVAVMATGRSDYANQVNNALCFPGIFRGALDCRASKITDGMKVAAAHAIAESVTAEQLKPDFVIPNVFNVAIPKLVAAAVREAAMREGVARLS